MTTVIPETGPEQIPTTLVVPVPDGPRAAATLSCRLHAAIAGGAASTVLVEVGERAADPAMARVLTCARESAESRGIDLLVR